MKGRKQIPQYMRVATGLNSTMGGGGGGGSGEGTRRLYKVIYRKFCPENIAG